MTVINSKNVIDNLAKELAEAKVSHYIQLDQIRQLEEENAAHVQHVEELEKNLDVLMEERDDLGRRVNELVQEQRSVMS